jgi:hypothetical protein
MVYYCIYIFPPTISILRQLDPIQQPIIYFLKIHLNIILPCKPGPFRWSRFLRIPHQIAVSSSPIPLPATCPAHLILLDLNNWTKFADQYRSLSSSLFSSLYSPVLSFSLVPNTLFNSLLQIPSAYIPPPMWAKTFHVHTQQRTKLCLCISKYLIYFGRKHEDKMLCTEWQQAFPDFNML